LTVSTILTLVIVPTLYVLFAASGIKRQHRKNKKLRAIQN